MDIPRSNPLSTWNTWTWPWTSSPLSQTNALVSQPEPGEALHVEGSRCERRSEGPLGLRAASLGPPRTRETSGNSEGSRRAEFPNSGSGLTLLTHPSWECPDPATDMVTPRLPRPQGQPASVFPVKATFHGHRPPAGPRAALIAEETRGENPPGRQTQGELPVLSLLAQEPEM